MDALWFSIFAGGVGLALGGTLAYIYVDRKSRADISGLQTAAALAEQRAAALAPQVDAERAAAVALREQLSESQGALVQARTQLASSEKNIAEQKQLIDHANEKLTQSFAAVSLETLEKNTKAFLEMAEMRFKTLSTEAAGNLDQRKAQIATLLKPLEEALANYQKRLAETETSRTSAYGELLKQIGSMSSTQQTLSTQTSQLVSALKKSNVRGRWGEIALQRLAEMAGMTEHVDFAQQESLRNDDGRLLRPDMIINLPGNRCVVVDSKAVMNAFLDAMAVTDEAPRLQFMQTHAKNVRARVDDLAGKAYWNQFPTAPDCVVLFLPGESFLYAACDIDPNLIEYALSKHVLLATPTTFIILLKSFELGWRQQALSQNAEAIRTLGTEIYDRLATLAGNMAKLGTSLDNAVDHYNKTIGTLETRVLVSARKIGELGARSDKEIAPPDPIDKRTRELSAPLNPDRSPLLGS